jgi:hypothetical protein
MDSQTTNAAPRAAQEPPDIQHPDWDWAKYIKYRPVYPDSLFNAIYNYHAAASPDNKFMAAHDVGAGPRNVSVRLAERFAHVVLSEPNREFLNIAKGRLTSSSCSDGSAVPKSKIQKKGKESKRPHPNSHTSPKVPSTPQSHRTLWTS